MIIVLVDFESFTTGTLRFELIRIGFGWGGETELGALRGTAWVLAGVIGDGLVLVGARFEGED